LVPHAGFAYSGQVAASGYASLPPGIERFVIVASNHSRSVRRSFKFALTEVEAFATPLGIVPVSILNDALRNDSLFSTIPEAHDSHVIEVQLPFLQERYGTFEILPIITGDVNKEDISQLAEIISETVNRKTRIIVSTDLSHYHPYAEACRLDQECLNALTSLNEEKALHCEACGLPGAIMLLKLARILNWKAELIQYQNSGDTSGDKSRVVGYASVAFYQ
ncbi:MAG: AmmeMemoRadiSam system protein B, partial [SAR324 cluster bacterium]|nr:AmmeMemoRadiSam system protein B [SAR324 cluster bacterium]